MGKYSCEKCAKEFSQKSHYDQHKRRKKPCDIQSDKFQEMIDKAVEQTLITQGLLVKPSVENRETTITHCDCAVGLQKLKDENKRVQLTVTSPPYFNVKDYVYYESYTNYLDTLRDVFSLVFDITDDGRMCCVNISNILIQRESRSGESQRIPLAFHFVSLMEGIGWKFIEDIVWVKPEGAVRNRNGSFFQHRQPIAYKPNIVNEYVFIFQKPTKGLIDQIVRGYDAVTSFNSKVSDEYERTNVWKMHPETKVDHPAPYPVELVDKLIKYYSFVGDTVLDPYMGSGTTALVAFKLNRKCIGFEIHEAYIRLYEERMLSVSQPTIATSIAIDPKDYVNLSEEQIRKKLARHPKNFLQTIHGDEKNKNKSKKELIDLVYDSVFATL